MTTIARFIDQGLVAVHAIVANVAILMGGEYGAPRFVFVKRVEFFKAINDHGLIKVPYAEFANTR